MSEEIPYLFETPILSFFVLSGWTNDPMNIPLLYHCFARCQTKARKTTYCGVDLKLAAYEFICGREEMAKICGLSPDQVKRRLQWWIDAGYLVKTANSNPNQFTCYKWNMKVFTKRRAQRHAQRDDPSKI